MSIAAEVRAALKERKRSQAAFALAVDVSTKHLSQFLGGHAGASMAALETMAEELGMEWKLVEKFSDERPFAPLFSDGLS